MKAKDVIKALGALAHEHRLAIFRLLVERGPAAEIFARPREAYTRELIEAAELG